MSDSESEEEEDNSAKNIQKQKIHVVRFVDPGLIYIKFTLKEKLEEDLHKELQVYYSVHNITKNNWKIGDLCVVLYGNSYVRGKIIGMNGEMYNVNLYDSAIDVEFYNDKLFVFDKCFNRYPNIVFKAHLANIGPAGGTTWSMASKEAIQKIFDTYHDLYATRVEGDTSQKSMPLKMWYTKVQIRGALEASVTKFKCINDLLVKLGYAYKKQLENTVEGRKTPDQGVLENPDSSKLPDMDKPTGKS